ARVRELAVALLFLQRVPKVGEPDRAAEQLRQQRRDQRAVDELRRHGVVAAFLEARANLLELRDAFGVRIVQRARARGLLLDARHVRANFRELVDGRVVVRAWRRSGALAQRAHLLALQRVADQLVALARDVVV